MRIGLRFGLAVGAVLALALPARAANFLELNFGLSGPRYDAVVPLCEDGGVLAKIQSRFAEKESRFWNSDLRIIGFENVGERTFMPRHHAAIPRRFCSGKAVISDGTVRPLHYWIGENTGAIGVTSGVEWCVVGLDRNWAYNPRCKMARP